VEDVYRIQYIQTVYFVNVCSLCDVSWLQSGQVRSGQA